MASRRNQASKPGFWGSFLFAATKISSALPLALLAGVSTLMHSNDIARVRSPPAGSNAEDMLEGQSLDLGYDGDSEEEEIRLEELKPAHHQDSIPVEGTSSASALAESIAFVPTMGLLTKVPTVDIAEPVTESYSAESWDKLVKVQKDEFESFKKLAMGGISSGDEADDTIKSFKASPAKVCKEDLEKFQVEEFGHLIDHLGPALKHKLFEGANPYNLDNVADETVLNDLGWSDIDSICSEYMMSPYTQDSDPEESDKSDDSVGETPLKRQCSELARDKSSAIDPSGAAQRHVCIMCVCLTLDCSAS